MTPVRGFSIRRAVFALLVVVLVGMAPRIFPQVLSAQQVGIPATAAFDAGCSDQQLGGITIHFTFFGDRTIPSPHRLDPEWAAIRPDARRLARSASPP